jgi:hypothetical protein
MAVNGAEEDGVENRAEPSLADGKTVLGDTPTENEEGDESPVAEPTADADEAQQAPAPDSAPAAAPSSAATPTEAPAPTYASQNGSSAGPQPGPRAASASAPPVTSLMAPPPNSGGGGTSIQDSAIAAMATAASGARGIASRIGASFASITKPRSRPPGRAGQPQAPPRPGQAPWPQAAGGMTGTRPAPQGAPPPRTALLSLQRIEPLSVMKFSSLISLVGFVVLFVATALVWFTLNKLGVFAKIEQTIGLVTYTKNHPGSNAAAWFSAKRVLGYTALIGAINAILFTALATIGAALYNLVTSLSGGIEVTLKETD